MENIEEFVENLKFIKDIEKNESTYGTFVHHNLVAYKRQGDFEFSRLITIQNATNAKKWNQLTALYCLMPRPVPVPIGNLQPCARSVATDEY